MKIDLGWGEGCLFISNNQLKPIRGFLSSNVETPGFFNWSFLHFHIR